MHHFGQIGRDKAGPQANGISLSIISDQAVAPKQRPACFCSRASSTPTGAQYQWHRSLTATRPGKGRNGPRQSLSGRAQSELQAEGATLARRNSALFWTPGDMWRSGGRERGGFWGVTALRIKLSPPGPLCNQSPAHSGRVEQNWYAIIMQFWTFLDYHHTDRL